MEAFNFFPLAVDGNNPESRYFAQHRVLKQLRQWNEWGFRFIPSRRSDSSNPVLNAVLCARDGQGG